MTQKNLRSHVPSLARSFLFLTVMLAFVSAPSSATTSLSVGGTPLAEDNIEAEEKDMTSESESEILRAEEESQEDSLSTPAQPGAEWKNYPNVCETFTVIEGTQRVKDKAGKMSYPIRFKRNRYDRRRSHQRHTRELIRLVAKEMGADAEGQYLVDMIAHHESSWNPEALHILNRDLEANLDAWERHSYDRGREMTLEEKLKTTSAKTKKFWSTKAELADLRMYKDNPFWNSQLEYVHKIPERTLHGDTTKEIEFTEQRSVWAYGYGLFGMNSVLYMHVWDNEAPPWVLCGDEGIVAVVTAIWALREQQSDCAFLTGKNAEKYGPDGGNARGVVRRFARGHCSDEKLGSAWRRLIADYSTHVDWEGRPDLGDKFPRYEMYKKNREWKFRFEMEIDPKTGDPKMNLKTGKPVYKRDSRGRKIKIPTDRQAILAHMRAKAAEEGLLRVMPLKREKPESKPVIVASMAATSAL